MMPALQLAELACKPTAHGASLERARTKPFAGGFLESEQLKTEFNKFFRRQPPNIPCLSKSQVRQGVTHELDDFLGLYFQVLGLAL